MCLLKLSPLRFFAALRGPHFMQRSQSIRKARGFAVWLFTLPTSFALMKNSIGLIRKTLSIAIFRGDKHPGGIESGMGSSSSGHAG